MSPDDIVVEYSTHNPKVKGLNLVTDTGRGKMAKIVINKVKSWWKGGRILDS